MDALSARFREAKATARRHIEAAERARTAGDLVGATEAFRAALRVTPGDRAIEAAIADLEKATAAQVVETRRRQAALEERYGHWTAAAASWKHVLDALPGDDEASRRLATALERSRAGDR
jgi:hypothetical protein